MKVLFSPPIVVVDRNATVVIITLKERTKDQTYKLTSVEDFCVYETRNFFCSMFLGSHLESLSNFIEGMLVFR